METKRPMRSSGAVATMAAPGVLIRAAALHDLPQMVVVHSAAFEGFFLTMLGAPFLHELYRGFVHDPSSICLVAEDQETGGLLGFVVGTLGPRGFFKRLLVRRGFCFAYAGIKGLLRHPLKVSARFLDALIYRGEAPAGFDGATLLSSIAVSPATRGRGIGAILVGCFCQHAMLRGARSVYLLTDSDDNETVNQFYRRCGFFLETSFQRRDGRRMNRHLRQLATTKASGGTECRAQ